MNENNELRFKVAPVWKGSYNPNTTYSISDEVSFTAENVPVGETTNVTYGHYRSLKNNNTDSLTNDQSWLLILDLSTIETVTQQGKEYNQQFNENETFRKDNERQRVENETIRVNNELTRVSNENERKSAETRRADAENNRASAENTRKSNEASRQTAELQRKSKEEQRVENEDARNTAEATRKSNEVNRQSNETNRKSAENTRQANESARQTNETVREQQEGAPTDNPNPTGSRWARYKQAENERTLLFNTSQTNRTTQYNKAEGTPEDEAAANGSRWARFKKAEETRDATVDEKVEDITNLQEDVENLKDTKANKDGYYSQMTVGAAETLVGQTVDSEAYLIRPTGGNSNDVANSVASVLDMEGHTEKWNQMIKNGDFADGTKYWVGITSISDGVASAVSTATGTPKITNIKQEITYTQGHKYFITVDARSDNSATLVGVVPTSIGEEGSTTYAYYANFTRVSWIWTSDVIGKRSLGIRGYNKTDPTQDVAFSVKNVKVIDLTAIFGAGNEPATVAEFEAWLAKNVGIKPYYGYNAGSLLSAQTLGVKTYGQNLLNPITRQARLIPYDWEENSNVYTIKNVPSGTTATFTPDATGVAETVDISGGSLDITSYGRGVLELSAATSETYVCMKWDEGKDDDVVPFEEHTYTFDVRKVYGKVNGAGEYVQCFPNGMKSAGNVKDSLTVASAIVKLYSAKAKDLNFTYNSTYNFWGSQNPWLNTFPKPKLHGELLSEKGWICSKTASYNTLQEDEISVTNSDESPIIRVKDDRLGTDISTFTAFVGESILIYELATPITYTDLIYRDSGIDTPLAGVLMNITVNNWSIEEQLLTPYDENGNPTAIPATIKTQYGMDAVEAIDTLQKTSYFAKDVRANLQALLTCINTNCAETLGGTFSISETATEKVFGFTFTQNTEPDVEPTNEGE